VFGARAGRVAAEYASQARETSPAIIAQAKDEQRRLETEILGKTGGRERIATLRDEMQKTMEQSAGIYRSGTALRLGVGRIAQIRERFADIAIEDHSRTFNTERLAALELSCMLDVADTIVSSALRREESRGAHQRTDFPARDDRHFLAHSLAHLEPDGSSRVEYLPVTITRWPPAERVYGETASHAGPHHVTGRQIPPGAGV
jgi:fumarate reductase flavoprotein subunit